MRAHAPKEAQTRAWAAIVGGCDSSSPSSWPQLASLARGSLSTSDVSMLIRPLLPFIRSFRVRGRGSEARAQTRGTRPPRMSSRGGPGAWWRRRDRLLHSLGHRLETARGIQRLASRAMAGASKAGGGLSLFTSASSMMVNPDTVDLTTDDANEDESPGKRAQDVARGEEGNEEVRPRRVPGEAKDQERKRRTHQEEEAGVQADVHLRRDGRSERAESSGSGDPIPKEVWQRILAHAPVSLAQGHQAGVQDAEERGGRRGVPALHQDRAADATDADDRRGSRHRRILLGEEEAAADTAGGGVAAMAGHASATLLLVKIFHSDRPLRDDEDHAAGIIQRIARDKPFATPMSASAPPRGRLRLASKGPRRETRGRWCGVTFPGRDWRRRCARTREVEDRGLTRVGAARGGDPRRRGGLRDHRAVALDAARRACVRTGREPDADDDGGGDADDGGERRHHAGDYCAREDLTEFISLLAMALRVPTSLDPRRRDEYDEALVAAERVAAGAPGRGGGVPGVDPASRGGG